MNRDKPPGFVGDDQTPPGSFFTVVEGIVPPGAWLAIGSVSAATIGETPDSIEDVNSFRTICELRDVNNGFIGGGAITGQTTHDRGQDRHEITVMAGMFVPEGSTNVIQLACAPDNGSAFSYGTEHGGARITLIQIGGFLAP